MGMPENQNTTEKTSDTTKKVPSDWMRVVMMMDLPDFFSLFQTSSVPIIRLTEHSKIDSMVLYQPASITSWSITERA